MKTLKSVATWTDDALDLVSEALGGYLYFCDLTSGVVERSARFTAVTGWSVDAIPPTTAAWLEHIHPEDRERLLSTFKELEADPGRDTIEHHYRIDRPNGGWTWLSDRQRHFRDESGAIIRIFGVAIDISARIAAEEERDRLLAEAQLARVEAETANRIKSEFLAVMSHELRTPLNAIDGYAELLQMGIRGELNDAQLLDIQRIRRSQRHLLALINQVLDYSRAEGGTVRFDLRSVRLTSLLEAAETLVAPQAAGRGLTLRDTRCPPDLHVLADDEKLQQIILNLLSNAIKYTEPGGEVRVDCHPDGALARITVTDTGIGIAADKLEQIFEPFVQLGRSSTSPAEGVGLGLAISRQFARGMGGDLTAESTPGVGSTFTLLVPLAGDPGAAEPAAS